MSLTAPPPIPVTEVTSIDAESFRRDFVEAHKPLIVRGALRDWDAMNWTDEYLEGAVGEQKVKVDIFPYSEQGRVLIPQAQRVEMMFRDFLGCYQNEAANHYVADINLFPRLHMDLGQHPVFEVFPIHRRKTFFMGNGKQESALHYDDNENIMCMASGEKEFLLYDTSDFVYMYAQDEEKDFCSDLDPVSPQFDKYPEFVHAQQYHARVGAGDLLYVPCYWWHKVNSHGRSVGVSYIINETIAQALVAIEKLIRHNALPVEESVRADLLAICHSDLKASKRKAKLKRYHRDYVKSGKESYYPHPIFERLIEESLFEILRGHASF